MKKGFTLIELLAVIVILAIIAVIAVPIVIDIIDDTKKNALEQSSNMYKKALETTIAKEMMKNKLEDGTYIIDEKGNIKYKNKIIKVEIKNYEFESGTVEIKDGNVKSLNLLNNNEVIVDNVTPTFDVWDGSIKEVKLDTDGNYHITKASELAWIAEQVNSGVNNFEGKTIYLENNLDLNNKEWTPIDNPKNYFKGIFEGKNNIIKNLKITRDITNEENSFLGLFGGIENGKILNLNIYDSFVSGYSHIAILCADSKNSYINNINIYNSEVKGTKNLSIAIADFRTNSVGENINAYFSLVSGTNIYVGGVIGILEDSELTNSFSNAVVNNSNITENLSATGGIVGGIYKNGTVSNLISYASVKANIGAGGIIGQFQNNSSLSNSISYSTVEGINRIGGVIGVDTAYLAENNIENIESYAKVIGNGEYIGGVVSYISQGIHNYKNIYSKAAVEGYDKVGGISGGFTVGSSTTLNYKNIISEAKVIGNTNVGDLHGYIDTSTSILKEIES